MELSLDNYRLPDEIPAVITEMNDRVTVCLRLLVSNGAPPEVVNKCYRTTPMPVLSSAMEERNERVLKVAFYVDNQGTPTSVRYVSGDYGAFKAVTQAISQWKFAEPNRSFSKRCIEIEFAWNRHTTRIRSFSERSVVEDLQSDLIPLG